MRMDKVVLRMVGLLDRLVRGTLMRVATAVQPTEGLFFFVREILDESVGAEKGMSG